MPELPEVEVVRRGLEPVVAGALVTSVEVRDPRGITRHDPGRGDFEAALISRRMRRTRRRGKFLWIELESRSGEPGYALLAHLGMSGQLLLRPAEARPDDDALVDGVRGGHVRVVLGLQHPRHGELAVWFADQRTFGSLAVDTLGADGVPSQVAHIAPDLLGDDFDEEQTLTRMGRTSSAIKRVLLDQTVVSGIGNIYADESLWAARVHPEVPARELSRQRARGLLDEARGVLLHALAEGGTSFDSQYVNVNGQAGYFARSLRAYGREGLPCTRCGTPLIRVSFANRSSHLCPGCQARP